MLKTKRLVHCVVLLLFAFSSTCVQAEPNNLGRLKLKLVHYHDSGAYAKDIETVVTQAQSYIDGQVALNQHSTHPKKLALVLDIDETCLSNYDYLRTVDFAYLPKKEQQHFLAADTPPIQPMLSLYQHALNKGIAIFFITWRDDNLREATIKNLHRVGFTHWSDIQFRYKNATSAQAYKTSLRAGIEANGYTIIASISDQYSDLIGGFAQKTFKIPNPYYHIS